MAKLVGLWIGIGFALVGMGLFYLSWMCFSLGYWFVAVFAFWFGFAPIGLIHPMLKDFGWFGAVDDD